MYHGAAAVVYLPLLVASYLVLVSSLPVVMSQHTLVLLPPLIVNEPPPIVVFTSQQSRVEGLHCVAQGSPQPVVRWRRRDSRLVDESWFQSDGTLLLPAHVTNTGFYQCVAENDAGIAMSNFTAVYSFDRHRNEKHDKRLTVAEGDAVVLACSLYRHSLPVHINWLDADTYDLISLDQFTAISDNRSLVLTSAKLTDSRVYKCRASFDTTPKIFYSEAYHVVVNALPDHVPRGYSFSGEWLTGTTAVTSLEGNDVNMSCIFSGRVDRIVWERADGRSVRGDVSDFGRRLTVTAVRRSDAGTYTCTAHYENHVAADDTGAIPSKTHVHHLTVRVELSVSAAKPRLVRPLMSRNISHLDQGVPVSFLCEPDPRTCTSSHSTSSSISTDATSSSCSITWYINAQPLTHDSDGDVGWWKLSSDRTQLTLARPRSCVVSCNISNQNASLLSTARLAVLPPGYLETPETSETATQLYSQQPDDDDDDDQQTSSQSSAVVKIFISSTFILAAGAVAAAGLALWFCWRRYKPLNNNHEKGEKEKEIVQSSAAEGDAAVSDDYQQQQDEDEDEADEVAEEDKSQSSTHSSSISASCDSGINFTQGDDDADVPNAGNSASEEQNAELQRLLNRLVDSVSRVSSQSSVASASS